MPYCSNCGAYLPDGVSKCVACGSVTNFASSPAAEASASSSSSSAASEGFAARHAEQQAKNAQWAKKAYEDYKKSDAYRSTHSEYSGVNSTSAHGVGTSYTHTTSARTGGTPSSASSRNGTVSKSTSKILAVLSYISGLCFLPYIFAPKDRFSMFHAKQGILVLALSIIADVVSKLFGLLGGILSIFRLYLVITGISNAIKEKEEQLPVIGKYADKF